MGLYASALVIDRITGEARWIRRSCPEFQAQVRASEERILSVLREACQKRTAIQGDEAVPSRGAELNWTDDWEPALSGKDYRAAVEKILDYLRRGDAYQVNLTNRFRREAGIGPTQVFDRMLQCNPAPFSAYVAGEDWAVISSSPELLLDLRRDGWIETRPIKGTVRRAGESAAEIAKLRASEKDRAEHLMIVDLERNDLGRICRPGTIHVDPFMTVESHRGLHHLVSGVRGRLRPKLGPADALAALFPGGSVTGAPKIRAMEIIGELEPVSRGVYTGAIGWITPEGDARFNLAIRTLAYQRGVLDLHVGGGIVIDSDPEAEAAECRLKGAAMAEAVERALETLDQPSDMAI
jgi:aminodeoxychorismate synthase component I